LKLLYLKIAVISVNRNHKMHGMRVDGCAALPLAVAGSAHRPEGGARVIGEYRIGPARGGETESRNRYTIFYPNFHYERRVRAGSRYPDFYTVCSDGT
jgi:hypothetical protein